MPIYRVKVPQNAKAGQTVTVSSNSGHFSVKIPKGAQPGESLLFKVESKDFELSDISDHKKRERKETILDSTISTKKDSPYEDLCYALFVGGCIGFAIALGYILGVLSVTEPLLPNREVPTAIPRMKLVNKPPSSGTTGEL
jgi:hypothetical protein